MRMKNLNCRSILFLYLFLIVCSTMKGQNVGISENGNVPDPTALLDVYSKEKGVLIPRMAEADKGGIINPAEGLLIYNTDSKSFQYFNGLSWINVTHSGIVNSNGANGKIAKFFSPWGLSPSMLSEDPGKGIALRVNPAYIPPDPSAIFDANSNNQGILVPRMASSSRTAILSPAIGLLVFDTTTSSFWYFSNSGWKEVGQGSGGVGWIVNGTDIHNSNTGEVGINMQSPAAQLHVYHDDISKDLLILEGRESGLKFDDNSMIFYDANDDTHYLERIGKDLFFSNTVKNENGNIYIGGTLLNMIGKQVTIGDFGTQPATNFKLSVKGNIICEELVVENYGNWPDYVFGPDYQLLDLKDLKAYIEKHQHLPNIPSAQEVSEKGFGVGEINKKLVEKVEELTLYILGLEERLSKLEAKDNIQTKP